MDQEATVAALKRKIEDLTAENSRLLFELHQEREKYAELQADYTQLEADMQQRLAEAHAAMQAQVAAARGSVDPVRLCQGYQDDLAVVCDDIYVRMSELQGEVDDLQGSLRVICRVRPFIRSATSLDLKAVQGVTTASKANSLKDESARAKIGMLKDIVDIIPDENLVRIRLATRKPTASQLADPAYKRPKGRHEDFVFSHALPYRRSHYTPGGATQEQVYESVKGIALSVLRGYNVVIFAYGGTGSGKTYTMQGPQGEIGDATYIPPIKEQGLCVLAFTPLPRLSLSLSLFLSLSLSHTHTRTHARTRPSLFPPHMIHSTPFHAGTTASSLIYFHTSESGRIVSLCWRLRWQTTTSTA